MTDAGSGDVRVAPPVLTSFVRDVLVSYDVPESDDGVTADALVAADVYGIDSHGVARLGFYMHKLGQDLVNPRAEPRISVDSGAVFVVDADNGLGPVGAQFAMGECIRRAEAGVAACASVGHSNHYGIAGYWALQAVAHGMIGVSLTNATALVAPTFGRSTMLGTNPIAVAVPTGDENPFLFDAATSAVSFGKLQLAATDGVDMPEGWALDSAGNPTTDPGQGMLGALVPLGGTRELGSHKGYGLAVLVDIFSALLSGAAWGPNCLSLTSEFNEVANVGHFFAAIRVDAFRPLDGFEAEMRDMTSGLRAAPTAPGESEVRVAGDPEWVCAAEREANGIPLSESLLANLRGLGASRGVDCPF
ncbi:MAG: Ldh family oxidoreductase [Acidimicrobiia bacterium]|nr:Ldh family oxidoreductase [Acidimicrobiia bacterium]